MIEKRVSPSGEISYRARVRVKGYAPISNTFKRKTDAQRWLERMRSDVRDDKYIPNAKAQKYTVSDLIDAYLESLKVKNPRRYKEIKPMLDWWKSEIGFTVLSGFKGEHVMKAQQKLLTRPKKSKNKEVAEQTLSFSTVNWYLIVLRTAKRNKIIITT